MINIQTVVRRSDAVLSSDLGNETIVMHVENDIYYGLNAVGTRILELVEQPISVGRLCEQLVGEYDVSLEVCQREVSQLLTNMLSGGLVEVDDERP